MPSDTDTISVTHLPSPSPEPQRESQDHHSLLGKILILPFRQRTAFYLVTICIFSPSGWVPSSPPTSHNKSTPWWYVLCCPEFVRKHGNSLGCEQRTTVTQKQQKSSFSKRPYYILKPENLLFRHSLARSLRVRPGEDNETFINSVP